MFYSNIEFCSGLTDRQVVTVVFFGSSIFSQSSHFVEMCWNNWASGIHLNFLRSHVHSQVIACSPSHTPLLSLPHPPSVFFCNSLIWLHLCVSPFLKWWFWRFTFDQVQGKYFYVLAGIMLEGLVKGGKRLTHQSCVFADFLPHFHLKLEKAQTQTFWESKCKLILMKKADKNCL